jgi:hypothetical protein
VGFMGPRQPCAPVPLTTHVHGCCCLPAGPARTAAAASAAAAAGAAAAPLLRPAGVAPPSTWPMSRPSPPWGKGPRPLARPPLLLPSPPLSPDSCATAACMRGRPWLLRDWGVLGWGGGGQAGVRGGSASSSGSHVLPPRQHRSSRPQGPPQAPSPYGRWLVGWLGRLVVASWLIVALLRTRECACAPNRTRTGRAPPHPAPPSPTVGLPAPACCAVPSRAAAAAVAAAAAGCGLPGSRPGRAQQAARRPPTSGLSRTQPAAQARAAHRPPACGPWGWSLLFSFLTQTGQGRRRDGGRARMQAGSCVSVWLLDGRGRGAAGTRTHGVFSQAGQQQVVDSRQDRHGSPRARVRVRRAFVDGSS